MKTIGVDPECIELAEHFLAEIEEAKNRALILQSLAEHIQSAVDDWFAAQNWEPRWLGHQ